jgi:hypothetical protein
VRGSLPLVVAALGALAPAPAAAITTQTVDDPVGGEPVAGMPTPDNCRAYTAPAGVFCGPDITRVVFSTPGDGNLHVDITYASLPLIFGTPQTVENVEIGLYPKTATARDFFWDRRVSRAAAGFSVNTPPTVHGAVAATLRPLGIELLVPLSAIGGDATLWRYVVNAGNIGEVVPEHPELVPNDGFIDLTGDAAPPGPVVPPAPVEPVVPPAPPAPPEPVVTPASVRALIAPLAGIAPVQRGPSLGGQVTLAGDADQITVEALVRPALLRSPTAAAPPPLKRIGVFTKRGVKAGKLTFRVPLSRATRAKLAVRPATAITLRITLRVGATKGVRSKQVTWKRPPSRP